MTSRADADAAAGRQRAAADPPRARAAGSLRAGPAALPSNATARDRRTIRLSRHRHGRPPASVRLVHLGSRNFVPAHQACLTDQAPDVAGCLRGADDALGTSRRHVRVADAALRGHVRTLLVVLVAGGEPS